MTADEERRLLAAICGESIQVKEVIMTDHQRKVLTKARELLEKGWIQHAYAKEECGEEVHVLSNMASSFCLVGALYRAAKKDFDSTPSLYRILDFQGEGEAIRWNDDKARTKAEVLAKIDAALA